MRLEPEPAGRHEDAHCDFSCAILPQDRFGLEVFCERFDTQKNIHRLRRNWRNLWMVWVDYLKLRNDVNGSDGWARRHFALRTLHCDHQTEVWQRGFGPDFRFIPARRIHY